MNQPACSTCSWFRPASYREYVHNGAKSYQPGSCHVAAPGSHGFPRVRSSDLCGRYRNQSGQQIAYVLIWQNGTIQQAFPTREEAETEAEAWVARNFQRPRVAMMQEVG